MESVLIKMKNKSYYTVIIVLLLTACGVKEDSESNLSLVNNEIFIKDNVTSIHKLLLKNETDESLQINTISGSCSCMLIDTGAMVLLPNEIREFSLQFSGNSSSDLETLTFIINNPLRFEQQDIKLIHEY